MKALLPYQFTIGGLGCILALFGLHQDIFTLTEGILFFVLMLSGFIHAGYHLILED